MTEYLTEITKLPPYMMFPRFLLDMEINETTKLLYVILLDRARLSLKNNGWENADGQVFIYYTIETLAKALHKSQMTVKTGLSVLEKHNLIMRKRQGPGMPNQIYVRLPADTDSILSPIQTESCPINSQNIIPNTDKKLSSSKKENTKIKSATGESKEIRSPYGSYQNVYLSDKEMEHIRESIPDWQHYIERLSVYMTSSGKSYQNHAATIISWAMQDHPTPQKRIYESEKYETL